MNDQEIFNHLCNIVIYTLVDESHKEHAVESNAVLVEAGVLDESETSDDGIDRIEAYNQYEKMVTDFAKKNLPSEFKQTLDYWGAKCFAKQGGMKDAFFAGDSPDKIKVFADFQSMEEYLVQNRPE